MYRHLDSYLYNTFDFMFENQTLKISAKHDVKTFSDQRVRNLILEFQQVHLTIALHHLGLRLLTQPCSAWLPQQPSSFFRRRCKLQQLLQKQPRLLRTLRNQVSRLGSDDLVKHLGSSSSPITLGQKMLIWIRKFGEIS